MNRTAKKVALMTAFADSWAEMSPSVQRKVGCVVFDPWCRDVLAFSFNGLGAGVDHDRCHGDTSAPSGEVHAEVNSLIKLDPTRIPYRGAIMYVGVQPCVPCAGAIINSRKVGLVIASMDTTASMLGIADLRKADISILEWHKGAKLGSLDLSLSMKIRQLKERWL